MKQELKQNAETVICMDCQRILPRTCFTTKNMLKSGLKGHCRTCDWFKRHKDLHVPEGWSRDEVYMVVDFIFTSADHVLNTLLNDLPGRTLENLIQIIQLLPIGNKKIQVKCTCHNCRKEILKPPSVYMLNQNVYCSHRCYIKDKTNTVSRGADNPNYKRVKTTCNYCGEPINITPWEAQNKNSFGEHHYFCSQKCYWKFRSMYYRGDKSPVIHRKWTQEQREHMRIVCVQHSRDAERFNSKPQLITNTILDHLKIKYKREYIIKYYAIDNYLSDSGLMIEVMGTYWHGSPIKYNKDRYKLNNTQARDLIRDKQKHSYIYNHCGVEILYLWEEDLEKNPDTCQALITAYVNNQGLLANYHSFNYSLNNQALELNSELIVPYQDMSITEYRDLIKSS